MNQVTVLFLKFISCIVAFLIGLDLFFDATMLEIFSFSLLVTIVGYIVVDRFILPRFGNRIALMSSFFLTYFSVWIFGSLLLDNYVQIGWGSVLSATVVVISELFIQRYRIVAISREQPEREREIRFNRKLAYGTEFAEEEIQDMDGARDENP